MLDISERWYFWFIVWSSLCEQEKRKKIKCACEELKNLKLTHIAHMQRLIN